MRLKAAQRKDLFASPAWTGRPTLAPTVTAGYKLQDGVVAVKNAEQRFGAGNQVVRAEQLTRQQLLEAASIVLDADVLTFALECDGLQPVDGFSSATVWYWKRRLTGTDGATLVYLLRQESGTDRAFLRQIARHVGTWDSFESQYALMLLAADERDQTKVLEHSEWILNNLKNAPVGAKHYALVFRMRAARSIGDTKIAREAARQLLAIGAGKWRGEALVIWGGSGEE